MKTKGGWTGRILDVDLTAGKTSSRDTMQYVPDFVGGLGVAAKIAWDELEPGVGALDPGNMLFIMAGPLTGTLASGAGRVEVAGIAPQQHPSVFSRSGMGGHWGAELKYAGYDGVVLRGKSDKPVYLWVHDGEVEIRDAGFLWGTGTFGTTQLLRNVHGPRTRVVSIGQAGEQLSRIAVLQTETGNAAGQGGFGAVMGSKNLKAIAVRGTQGVALARPRQFMDLCMNASTEGQTPRGHGIERQRDHKVDANLRIRKCGFCATPCAHPMYMNLPTATGAGMTTTARHCWGYRAPREVEAEARAMTSDYGLNGWEITYGIIPWLQLCRQHGLIDAVDGVEIAVPDQPIEYLRDKVGSTGEFLKTLVRKMAFREGELGTALADGACYAADTLFGGEGKPLLDRIYPRHCGQTEHWGGHWGPGGTVYWPWWLPPILQWCVDTRDPANDSIHQWTEHVQFYMPVSGPRRGPFSPEKVKAVCAKVYGNPDVCDAAFEYDPPELKVIPARWHSHRGMIIDSLVLCDYENTRVFSMESEDGAADTAQMSKLLSAATGVDMSEQELDVAGERIWNVFRAIDVRNHARDREIDESTIDGFMFPGKDDDVMPDRTKLLALLDKYYEMAGWSGDKGWPTRAKLEELGLDKVADGLEGLGKLG